jgi:hypothetical protein
MSVGNQRACLPPHRRQVTLVQHSPGVGVALLGSAQQIGVTQMACLESPFLEAAKYK